MKKLLITSMAAVAVSICAKATETSYNTKESFEGFAAEGPLFGRQTENKEAYAVTPGWVTTATPEDGIFTVTNIENYVGKDTHETVSRPIDDTPNAKALAIDTSNPLMRTVHTTPDSSDALGQAVFFDSVVQFTATDAKPTPGNDDKLMVWLYASDDVDNDNPGVFGETTPTTNLIITASYYESGNYVVTNYLTGVEIQPDSWHRLTIKSFKDSGHLKFNVWVDKTPVTGGTESDFISLQYASENVDTTLKGVAFEGKGVVDDLVFTTDAPTFAGGGEDPEENVKMTVTFNDINAIATALIDGTSQSSNSCEYQYLKDSELTIMFMLNQGYEFVSSSPEAIYNGTFYTITVKLDEEKTVTIETRLTGGGDNGPTVGDTTYATEEALKAVVKSGTNITVPSGWSVDGKVLKKADGTPFATFEYYNLALADGIVTATLDQKAAAPFAEATEGQEVLDLDATMDDGETPAVGIRIKTFKGLYYGLGTAAELGSSWTPPAADAWKVSTGDGTVIKLTAPKQGDTRFYRIEVKDINPNPAQ